MKTHTAKTTAEIRKSNRYSHAHRVHFLRLRGKWLAEYGFSEGTTAYITETPEGLLISKHPPNPPNSHPLKRSKSNTNHSIFQLKGKKT